jgi:hypothetical protein
LVTGQRQNVQREAVLAVDLMALDGAQFPVHRAELQHANPHCLGAECRCRRTGKHSKSGRKSCQRFQQAHPDLPSFQGV